MSARGYERIREIASQRLALVRAMKELAREQPRILAVVDAAASGDAAQGDADALLDSHLAARDRCIASMHASDDEWRSLARGATEWTGDEVGALRATVQEVLDGLGELEASDARFASELDARRVAARNGIARADQGRAAHRAYGNQAGGSPRFTDRMG